MGDPRHKALQRFNVPGHAHYLTFTCYRGFPLLNRDRSRRWLIESIAAARDRFDFALWAYVIMPEHGHVLFRPRRQTYDIGHVLAAIKRPVAVAARAYLESTADARWLERLSVKRGRRTVFRIWQAGGGHDRNLWNDRPIAAAIDYTHENPVRRGLVERAQD